MTQRRFYSALPIVTFLFLLFLSHAHAATNWTVTNDTQALYHLEDLTAATNTNLVAFGSPTFVPAHFNNGAQFVRSNQQFLCTAYNPSGWNGASSTDIISFRINSEPATNVVYTIFERDLDQHYEIQVQYRDNGGTKQLFVQLDTNPFVDIVHNVDLVDGNFHNLVMSYNVTSGHSEVWLDGISIGSGTGGAPAGQVHRTNIALGAYMNDFACGVNPNNWLDGIVDEYIFLKSAWTQTDVTNYLNNFFLGGAPTMVKPTVGGRVTQLFRPTVTTSRGVVISGHSGIDIDSTINGIPVVAAGPGIIVKKAISDGDCGDWLWIFHGDITRLNSATSSRISTTYLHLTSITPTLALGSPVVQGEQLGLVDSTGLVTGPHLHFGVRQGDIPTTRGCQQSSRIGDTTVALDPLQFVDYQIGLSQALNVVLFSPGDIVLTDPDGLIISKQLNQLAGGARYTETKFLSSASSNATSVEEGVSEYGSVVVDSRKAGDYLINVVPASNVTPTTTYSLVEVSNATTTILAAAVQIQNVPNHPYVMRSTTSTIEEIIPAQIRIDPRTLNLASEGVLTTFMQISQGFGATVKDVALSTIRLAGASAVKTIIDLGNNTLIAKFNRRDLVNVPVGNNVKIMLVAKLKDGTQIEGNDTISVINSGSNKGLALLLVSLHDVLTQLLNTLLQQ